MILLLAGARVKGESVVAMELPMLGELPYILPLLHRMARSPGYLVILACREYREFISMAGQYLPLDISGRVHLVDFHHLDILGAFIDLFITSEQFNLGRPGIYSICVFHGQPSKGITFTTQILESFDMFFFLGPLHQAALERFIRHKGETVRHVPEIFEAGYPKLDDLLNRSYDRSTVLQGVGLRCDRKTVLYAPAFNEFASLRTIGVELIKTLISIDELNVIIKLAPDSINKPDDYYATGGVNWKILLKRFESDRCKIADSLDINSYLEAADIMVTDVSGVAYDFLQLGKPVIYYDCPDFYTKYVPRYDGTLSFEECMADDTVNAGRNYGIVVKNLAELRRTVTECLGSGYDAFCPPGELQMKLLYNPGRATDASFKQIEKLLESKIVSKRAEQGRNLFSLTVIWAKGVFYSLGKNLISRLLLVFGYRLTRAGLGYYDAEITVNGANLAGLSVCDYLESRERDERKRGRRDRIIEKLKSLGLFESSTHVCEIGAGTGMYLEKVIVEAKPEHYEVYETDPGWSRYLQKEYAPCYGGGLHIHCADGVSLKETANGSCDLVHAHGVFVYLPALQSLEYIKEAARICKAGGHVVFDCYLDTTFSLTVTQSWLDSEWRFPVIIPEKLLMEFASMHSLQLDATFSVIHGAASVDYLVFSKVSEQIPSS